MYMGYPDLNMRFATSTSTAYTHTKKECVRHILMEVRHLLKKKWWESKAFSMRELECWLNNYDEADE